ncbi:MAG: vitamin B12 ABC transporter permease BtuC [Halobacteria archaeon]
MRCSVRTAVWTTGLLLLLVVTVVVSAGIGPVDVPPGTVGAVILDGIKIPSVSIDVHRPDIASKLTIEYISVLSRSVPGTSKTIVLGVRIPRILLGATVGFALSAAGVVMQGFFRNPMADPSIIGVSSGAAAGAVAVLTLPFGLPFGLGLHTAAFAGGLITAFGIYRLGSKGGRTPVATLLLAGVAVQIFLSAVISYMLVESKRGLRSAMYWLMGHLHNATWGEVKILSLGVALLFLILLLYRQDLNVLLMGETEAESLGIDVEHTKKVLLAVSSLVTALAVSVSGVIGFVGLIIPHIMRLLVGPDHRILLPTSALAGASFLVATDTVARSGAAEVPVGIVTAAVGAPFFVYLLRTRDVMEL